MKTNLKFARIVSGSLIVCMAALPLQASAGLIGSGEVVSAVQAVQARDTVARFLAREDVAAKLEALGVTRTEAQARAAALTDAELATLAGRIDRLPAAADGSGIGFLLIALLLLWRFVFSDEAKAAAAKPAPKEAPKK